MLSEIMDTLSGRGDKFDDLPDTIDLPEWFPTPVFPHYKEGVFGDWELVANTPPVMRGYFSGLQQMDYTNYVLKREDTVWMSLTPMETDTNAMAIAAAKGNVVVGGLGMGYVIFNMAIYPKVDHIWVFEKDADVIEAFHQFSDFENWPFKDKITIINEDILKVGTFTGGTLDFLYMDIWEQLGNYDSHPHTMTAFKNLGPEKVLWWGIELDYIEWLNEKGWSIGDATTFNHKLWVKSTGLPLATLDYPEWPKMAEVSCVNMVQY